MRKAFSIFLRIIAGFLLYTVSLLAFIDEPLTGAKTAILLVPLIAAAAALGIAILLDPSDHWKRDTGIVFLITAGFTSFLIFTIACLHMSEEFMAMVRPGSFSYFSDYLTGGFFIGVLAVLGFFFLKSNKKNAEQPSEIGR